MLDVGADSPSHEGFLRRYCWGCCLKIGNCHSWVTTLRCTWLHTERCCCDIFCFHRRSSIIYVLLLWALSWMPHIPLRFGNLSEHPLRFSDEVCFGDVDILSLKLLCQVTTGLSNEFLSRIVPFSLSSRTPTTLGNSIKSQQGVPLRLSHRLLLGNEEHWHSNWPLSMAWTLIWLLFRNLFEINLADRHHLIIGVGL